MKNTVSVIFLIIGLVSTFTILAIQGGKSHMEVALAPIMTPAPRVVADPVKDAYHRGLKAGMSISREFFEKGKTEADFNKFFQRIYRENLPESLIDSTSL